MKTRVHHNNENGACGWVKSTENLLYKNTYMNVQAYTEIMRMVPAVELM